MQTFLPHSDFTACAKSLDRQRLGCQRKEALQILKISIAIKQGSLSGWAKHPARLMWASNLHSLCQYGIAVCTEWKQRGYIDNLKPQFEEAIGALENNGQPSWLGREDIHMAYRSNLLRKGVERYYEKGKRDILDWYESQWPDIPVNLPYVWPSKEES